MPNYIIGDVQGCLDGLKKLLDKINYHDSDQLYFAGDIINRGPQSLATLRFIKNLKQANTVLGNHDLHLLAVKANVRASKKDDTINEILQAEDSDDLINWLKQRPLLIYLQEFNSIIVHAGIYPQWSLTQALNYAHEIEQALQQSNDLHILRDAFGNQPAAWSENLQGSERLRCLINIFTRMRYLKANGELDFACKTKPPHPNKSIKPWFAYPLATQEKIFFGHWAALEANSHHVQVTALDSGYVWGGQLTAYCLEKEACFCVANK